MLTASSLRTAGVRQPHDRLQGQPGQRLLVPGQGVLRQPQIFQRQNLLQSQGSQLVACKARRNPSEDYDGRRRSTGSRSQGIDITINGNRISLSQENMWGLAVPALMVLGLASLIGPLVTGLAVMVLGIAAAGAVGAFALSAMFWIPFVAMFGFLSLFLFPLAIFPFATFGLGWLLPKMLSMAFMGVFQMMARTLLLQAIALGGVAVGWSLFSRMLPSQNTQAGSRAGYDDGPVIRADSRSVDEEKLSPEEEEVRRQADELRRFDELLAESEAKRKVDDWRRSRF